jgi:hypothetical protein
MVEGRSSFAASFFATSSWKPKIIVTISPDGTAVAKEDGSNSHVWQVKKSDL